MLQSSHKSSLYFRRLFVSVGVAGSIGTVEWIEIGSPIGFVFALVMGLAALLVAPLPWLWWLPWGKRFSTPALLGRMALVVLSSTLVVALGFALYYQLLIVLSISQKARLLGAESTLFASIPLFTAAGWGLARHLELERRLEVQNAQALSLRQDLEQARLQALRSRLDPHFLFNSLNLVAELCRDEPEEAERCVIRLGSLLRAVLRHGEQPTIPLSAELDLCEDYLELCRTRFGERLSVRIDRKEALEGISIPLFSVQVLCENAVKHGVEKRPEGGEVSIAVSADKDTTVVEVVSPGPFRKPSKGPSRGIGGLGLNLVQKRLALSNPGSSLEVGTRPDGQSTSAKLEIAAKTPEAKPQGAE
jgi:two-component system sensor histidine kinase AlgZ